MTEIHTLELGSMRNQVHLVIDRPSATMAVVDPAWEVEKVVDYAATAGVEITMILLTHGHHDHINGVEPLREATGAAVYLSAEEERFFDLESFGWNTLMPPSTLALGESVIEVVPTPGHTPGGVCYHVDGHLISGDTLFVFGCGRCDLEGGDPRQLYHSLQRLCRELDPQTVVHPGHSYSTQPTSTLAEEIAGNPFLHCGSEEAFVDYRMVQHDRERSAPYGPVGRA